VPTLDSSGSSLLATLAGADGLRPTSCCFTIWATSWLTQSAGPVRVGGVGCAISCGCMQNRTAWDQIHQYHVLKTMTTSFVALNLYFYIYEARYTIRMTGQPPEPQPSAL
jgi:hypothetical protein